MCCIVTLACFTAPILVAVFGVGGLYYATDPTVETIECSDPAVHPFVSATTELTRQRSSENRCAASSSLLCREVHAGSGSTLDPRDGVSRAIVKSAPILAIRLSRMQRQAL